MPTITLNVGDTFLANCVYKDDEGEPVSLTDSGVTITAVARCNDGGVEIPLEVEILDQDETLGRFKIQSNTASWFRAKFSRSWDVFFKFVDSNDYQHSATMTVKLND